MTDLVLYSSTDFPQVQGRLAYILFPKLADFLGAMGKKVIAVTPEEYPGIHFSHTERFMRWIHGERPRVVCFWTSKEPERYLAATMNQWGIDTWFAESGWFPQEGTLYIDEEGCGPESSLVNYTPPEAPGEFKLPEHAPGEYIGIVGQCEGDFNVVHSPIQRMGHLVEVVSKSFPGEPLLYRPHPRNMDALVPQVEKDYSPSVEDFFKRCKCLVGLTSTALLQGLACGVPTYALGPVLGASSGAFLTRPTPLEKLYPKEREELTKCATNLVFDLTRRQLKIEGLTERAIKAHPVLKTL